MLHGSEPLPVGIGNQLTLVVPAFHRLLFDHRHSFTELDNRRHSCLTMDTPLRYASHGIPKDLHSLERAQVLHYPAPVRLDAPPLEFTFQTPTTV